MENKPSIEQIKEKIKKKREKFVELEPEVLKLKDELNKKDDELQELAKDIEMYQNIVDGKDEMQTATIIRNLNLETGKMKVTINFVVPDKKEQLQSFSQDFFKFISVIEDTFEDLHILITGAEKGVYDPKIFLNKVNEVMNPDS